MTNTDLIISRKLLQADIAESRQSANQILVAASLMQMLTNAVNTIIDKLSIMKDIANKTLKACTSSAKKSKCKKTSKT